MKGKFRLLASIAAVGAAVTTMLALSTTSGEKLQTSLIQQRALPSGQKSQTKQFSASEQGTPYWTIAQSYYHDGSLDPENGDQRQFGTRVEINGDKATVYGLVDLYFDEVDQEYSVEGTYDNRANTITIEGTGYDSDKPVSSFIKLADMYSLTKLETYTIVLFAGDMYGQQLETIDRLVFNVSDDLSTITAQTGFGAYAFDANGNPMAFYDYYQPGVKMTKATPDSGLAVSTETLDFNGLFVTPGMTVKQTFFVYNRSSVEASFNLSSSAAELVPSMAQGTLVPCSYTPVEVTLSPSAAGAFNGSLTLTSSALAEPIVLTADIDVWERPNYDLITKEGSAPIDFDMSPVFPFIITEYDGHVAAKSTNNGKGDGIESYFVCKLNVPDGQTGLFFWKAEQLTSQPNTLLVMLDGEVIKDDYYVQTSDPVDMSGIVALPEGEHEVVFCQYIMLDWSAYGDISEGYVWDLDFQLMDTQDNLAYLEQDIADFGKTYYDGLSVKMEKTVTLLNVGTAPLKVTEVRGSGNFSGKVPSDSTPQGGEIWVPLTWTASAVGNDAADVVIVTNAGEFTVHCKGLGEALPYNYSQFVTEGQIAFNTDVKWPFKISDNGNYLYNSSSKADIDGITESWIEAIFDVPEGQIGMISWDAINDSEDLFVFMNQPSLISGTRINIDDQIEEMIGGQGVRCGSANIFTPDQLSFKEGRHVVRFTYKKTSNEERFVFGEDRFKLFEIGLKLENVEDHKGVLTSTSIEYSNEVFVGTAGHYPVSLINYTSTPAQLISTECDGPFSAEVVGSANGNLSLMIEFVPKNWGEYQNDLVLKTNIGDYTISCKGKAKESSLGTALFYESFEYDFGPYWVMKDANNDDNTWDRLSPYVEAFQYQGLAPYDGSEGLLLKGYDPNEYQYYDTDDYASTPKITIPEDGITTLRFMAATHTYMLESLDIMAGEGDDAAQYEVVKTFAFSSPTDWQAYQADLSSFAGKTIRIAFRANEVGDYIALDDILVATTGTTGISTVNADKEIVAVEYYSISGKRLDQPANGVNVVVTRYSDGSTRTEKRMIKD